MKQLFRSILSVAAAATLLIGCSKDATETPAPAAGEFTLNLVTGADTRTEIYDPGEGKGVNIKWSENDEAAIYVKSSFNGASKASITNDIATFTLQTSKINAADSYLVQSFYPNAAFARNNQIDNSAIKSFGLKLPAAQEATTATFDKNADILVAKNLNVDVTEADLASENKTKTVEGFTFGRTTAITKITFKVTNAELTASEEKVRSIALSVENETEPKMLAGNFSFDPTAFEYVTDEGIADRNNIFYAEASNKVTVTLTDTPAVNAAFTAWISTAPVSLTNGDKLTFTVTTDAGTTITKTATVGKDLAFMTTRLNTMTVNLNDGVTIDKPVVVEPGAHAVDFIFKDMGYDNGVDLTTKNVAKDPITIVFSKGSNKNNAPKYYNSSTAVHTYFGNTFTVSGPEGITIKTIELTFKDPGKYNAEITTNPEGYIETGLWSGSAQKVAFTLSGTSGQRRILSIKVTYDTTSSDEPQIIAQDITAPAVGGTYEATYTIAKANSDEDVLEEPEVDGSVVTYAYAGEGLILYNVSNNFTAEAKEGWIKLSTASGLSKTIKVTQQASKLEVSTEAITIADGATTATFTVTSPEFIWNIDASTGIEVTPGIIEYPTTEPVTVTVTYEGTATGEVGTLTLYRTDNDPQQKIVTVSKQAPVTQGDKNVTFDFSKMGYTDKENVTEATKTPILITLNANDGTAPIYYNNGTALRVYKKNIFTIGAAADATSPVTITKLEFTFDDSTAANISSTSGTYTTSDSNTGTWIGSEASVTFNVSATTRIQTIKVTYDGPEPGPEKLLTPKVAATQDGTSVTLTWNAVANAAKYVYTIGSQSGETTETTVTVPMAEGTYDWSVTAQVADGETQYLNSEPATGSIEVKAPVVGGDPQTVTIDLSEQGYKNQEEVTSVTEGPITVTFDKGTNSNTPKYYTTGTAVRVYGGSYFTVSGTNATITKITLGFGTGDGKNTITSSPEGYDSEKGWTGTTTDGVKFTIGGTSGNRRIKTITVTYN